MSETGELMVTFRPGVSEDAARSVAAAAGATVRRRMRTDGPEEVLLLVKVPTGQLSAVESGLGSHPDVVAVERNHGGFSIR
jgi:hypothetical protein